jgi:mannose-6-phosphate isomerase-like protein (cupin superfamily)
MQVYDTDDFPCVEFGDEIKRQIRLIFSPALGNAVGVNIVTADIPPGGISEGHVHPDCDEIIHFNISGLAVIDGLSMDVPANGFVYAPKGSKHECVNTSAEGTLQLLCIFVPPFQPYGRYPELIEKTKQYLMDMSGDSDG